MGAAAADPRALPQPRHCGAAPRLPGTYLPSVVAVVVVVVVVVALLLLLLLVLM